jgi:hypothetical protein
VKANGATAQAIYVLTDRLNGSSSPSGILPRRDAVEPKSLHHFELCVTETSALAVERDFDSNPPT